MGRNKYYHKQAHRSDNYRCNKNLAQRASRHIEHLRHLALMKNILSERMFSGLKFHFFAPAKLTRNTAHDNFAKFNSGGATAPSFYNNPAQLNIEDGSYSLNLKAGNLCNGN